MDSATDLILLIFEAKKNRARNTATTAITLKHHQGNFKKQNLKFTCLVFETLEIYILAVHLHIILSFIGFYVTQQAWGVPNWDLLSQNHISAGKHISVLQATLWLFTFQAQEQNLRINQDIYWSTETKSTEGYGGTLT